MSTTTQSPAVEQAKQYVSMCKDRMLKTFSFVPDDKLTWSPSPTCKSSLRIVAHCGNSNGFFANIIRGEKMPEMSREDMEAYMEAAETAITTREAAIENLENSTAEVLALLDTLTPEQIDSVVETPFFTAPMTFWMNLPGRHIDNHASQIDMLQTCWGDMVWHM